jgi:nucleoside-diphosphate-sugar epimerase
MVIGNGLIGKKFNESESKNYIFFGSGVSDSTSNDLTEFKREVVLIKKYLEICGNKIFVYFSTVSILLKKTPYTEHKKNIENIIKKSKRKFFIFRVPQVVGSGGNQKNIFNHFKSCVKNKMKMKVYDVKRALIDIDDLYDIVWFILKKYRSNKIYILSGIEIIKISKLVKLFYQFFNEVENFEFFNYSENEYPNNSTEVDEAISLLGIKNKFYTKKLLFKYANIR